MLNRVEHAALIQIAPCTSDIETQQRHCGRKKSRRFKFGKGHPLIASHKQVLRSKQPVIIFTGGSPPQHPGEPPELLHEKKHKAWQRKADYFAKYYLVAFRPEINMCEEGQPNYLSHDWNALCDFVNELEQSNWLIDKLRLDALFNAIYGLKTTNENKIMMTKYRGRNRTLWSEEEQKSIEHYDEA